MAVLPSFSWDFLPNYVHSCNNSGPWNDAALQRLAEIPVITIEKCHNNPELAKGKVLADTVGAACSAIHAVNPSSHVIYYTNTEMDYYMMGLYEYLKKDPSLRLKDAKGKDVIFPGANTFAFNIPDPRMQKLYLDDCVNTTLAANGGCNGCYLDRATTQSFPAGSSTPAQQKAFLAAHDQQIYGTNAALAATSKGYAIFNNPGPVDSPGEMRPEGTAAMFEEWTADETYIVRLQKAAKAGTMIEAHAGNRKGGSDNYCEEITNSLAAFLIGMGEHHYYHCSSGKTGFWPGKWATNPLWPNAPDEWLDVRPEYTKKAGSTNG